LKSSNVSRLKPLKNNRFPPPQSGKEGGCPPDADTVLCASQVSVMQQELQDLQPELIQTSENTEQLMIKIEQDTVEVEAKREVLACI